MPLSFAEVKAVFPEVKRSDALDHIEYTVHCVCPERARMKVSINPDTGVYYCHKCSKAGNAIAEFFDPLGSPYADLHLNREEDRHTKRNYEIMWGVDKTIPAPGKCCDIGGLHPEHPARQYLVGRGFDIDRLSREMHVMYCYGSPQFKFLKTESTCGRIIFPVIQSEDVVGWQARMVEREISATQKQVWKGDKDGWFDVGKQPDGRWANHDVPKYYTCPGMPRSTSLMCFDKAVSESRRFVVITEGPLDVAAVQKYCVGTMGKGISDAQIRIIKANWENVILLRDAGVLSPELQIKKPREYNRYKNMMENLATGINFVSMDPPPGRSDPGSSPTQEIWSHIAQEVSGKLPKDIVMEIQQIAKG